MRNIGLHRAMTMKWKDACTVIITAPCSKALNIKESSPSGPDFDILMLKRSAKSSFYPNAYVFPGGTIDQADCSSRWVDLFNSVDKRFISFFDKLKVNQTDGRRAPMFLENSNITLLKEVAYRICAIRETFEETGVLLIRNNSKNLGLSEIKTAEDVHEFIDVNEAALWRKRVHEDASQFFDLFAELSCVPDVWSLHEWSNWLTPSHSFAKMSKRFDTVFYTASVPRIPQHCRQDDKETTHMILNTASEILEAYSDRRISLGPPQIYELARMLNFTKLADFEKFASQRGLKGMERWLPVAAFTTDGAAVMLYPGDHWYPEEAATSGDGSNIKIPMTYSEMLEAEPKCLNHITVNLKSGRFATKAPWTPRYGHVNPLSFDVRDNKFDHKL